MKWDVTVGRTMHGVNDGHRFTLDVAFASDASRIVLFGASGAGKTLTLMSIAGLMRPDAGHVRVDGRTFFDRERDVFVPPRDRRLGYVFQDYALFPHLTVRQNVAFGLAVGLRNPARKADDERVREWMALLELDTLGDRYPVQLSGGQRQRTALARAVVAKPRALLLDEPFAALDTPLRRRLRRELLAIQAKLALPVMLITHDEADAEAFAECTVRVDAGRVVEVVAGSSPALDGAALTA